MKNCIKTEFEEEKKKDYGCVKRQKMLALASMNVRAAKNGGADR